MVIQLTWRLAKKQKLMRQEKVAKRKALLQDIEDIVTGCADAAIDFINRLPYNLQVAARYHKPVAQKQVFKRLREFVQRKREREQKRVAGLLQVEWGEDAGGAGKGGRGRGELERRE
jgi:hypothetical protein